MNFVEYLKTRQGLNVGKGADEKDIKEAERQLGVSFSAEYKDYLIKFGQAMFAGRELTGIGNVGRLNVVIVTGKQRKYNHAVNEKLYVIENLDGLIIWQDKNGLIYQTENSEEPKKIASSMLEYFEGSNK